MKSIFNSLDPHSLAQHLAFYELYKETVEGKKALEHAWKLLSHGNQSQYVEDFPFPQIDIQAIVSLVTRQSFDPPISLSEEQLNIVSSLSSHFANRKLKGCSIWTKEELFNLPSEETDLGRALLINQFDEEENIRDKILQYEASLDLMALQVSVRLPKNATPIDKIREINRFIFQEMRFRFPPHALYAKDIDLYTFLPSVLDNRQGVCLGVSILYLCLAQRLDLPLEIITPPGHIFVRWENGDEVINIETTARGINPSDETYLGINTRLLQRRTLKEVVGMAFVNQASVYWAKEEYQKTVTLYEKALPYLPDDPLIKMFLGFNYLFIGKIEKGSELLSQIRNLVFDHAVVAESLPQDYLNGAIEIEGLKSVFLPVDETRESVLEKQKSLQDIVKKYPRFRGGILQLAVTYLQLNRASEALNILKSYHKIDPNDPTVEYYLAVLCVERLDYNGAWEYLKRAENITRTRNHSPKALKGLRHHLRTISPLI
ncbi:MAG TPA: transglutaminase family protein [Rhabdochlamydiaceae bacterium]|nr:transglutaminase family protein [Rhabdochlamydiaceae bacterium]